MAPALEVGHALLRVSLLQHYHRSFRQFGPDCYHSEYHHPLTVSFKRDLGLTMCQACAEALDRAQFRQGLGDRTPFVGEHAPLFDELGQIIKSLTNQMAQTDGLTSVRDFLQQ